MNPPFDIIIVGAGPAGSSCGAFCATAGLRTLIIEKAQFPREKVCGDCINPGCWPVLERLGVAEQVLALPHSKIAQVEFRPRKGGRIQVGLPPSVPGEISVKRSLFDQVLLQRAVECGAETIQGEVVKSLGATGLGWRVEAGNRSYESKFLVAADGRNSTIARLLGLARSLIRDRVALQSHLPVPNGFGEKIVLQQLDQGYCGLASLGGDQLNVCLVSRPEGIPSLKRWAEQELGISPAQKWRSVTPLSRAPIESARPNLLFVGDSARVVEPFTGEGIYYALASGELAGKYLVGASAGAGNFREFRTAHARLYRGRLWINRLAQQAMVHPFLGDAILNAALWYPGLLRGLTHRVLGKRLGSQEGTESTEIRQTK